MKQLYILLIFITLLSCKTHYDVVREIDKEHRHAPPGTVWIKDSIYMDQTEISNLDYLEYLVWLDMHDTTLYYKALPDTTVWREQSNYNEPYVEYYLRHPAYRDYPVVGVSYEQATDYCKWRTMRVKEFISLKKRNNTIEGTFGVKDFNYRLPNKDEWEYAASATTGTAYGFVKMQANDNTPNFNVKETSLLGYDDIGADITQPVFYKKPNSFSLYNAIGNVAEMISEKAVCKGGSWIHSIKDCEITDSIKYEKPSAWLGFRCVCVVTK